jgi:site-specific DNA-methyltransferase (adenine-specific)
LYNADCLDHPELWLAGDVLVTDPPYGLEELAGAYGMTHRTIVGDKDTTARDRVLELWGDRPAAVFGSPRLQEPPGGWSDRLVWDKGQLGMNGGPWRYAHESIFVRGAGWSRVDARSTSILRHSTQANRQHVAKHIHSKPVPLLEQLILAAPAGTIVDPFAGGGATVAAASLLGRSVIAFEIDEDHCRTIVERLGQQSFDFEGLR